MYTQKDRDILRKLAERVREIAELPEMEKRRTRWSSFNGLKPERPMVLSYPEGAWGELLPESGMQCMDKQLRTWEWKLRSQIYWWEHIRDDNALESRFNIPWDITAGDYGVEIKADHGEGRGSFKYISPITDLKRDMDKLHFREYTVNRESTMQSLSLADELFGDLLPSRIRGTTYLTSSVTWEVLKLFGMDAMFLAMYDDPDNLHKLIKFINDDQIRYYDWLEREGLLTLDNENDYVGTGGVGYTDELPKSDLKDINPLRLKDLWGRADSQETIGASPAMFADFVLQYQVELLSKFGLNCYGCCEPVNERWNYIKTVPNLRRVSVSPWCDQEKMVEYLGKNYVYSRKPNPTMVCTMFDEDAIRKDIRNTLKIAKDCVLEIVLKDTHTVENKPERISRWVEIALEEVQSI
ncbi:MAG TPA: hypothetical protein VIK78_21875 [Ruminiclostridium sp.]